jgi:uncharacterized membrane protein YqjE
MTAPQTQRSFPEVLHDIVDNIQAMVRAEFQLAKTELSEKADAATKPAIGLGTALLISVYGCLFLLLSGVFALSLVMPLWASALVVGSLLTALGSILAITCMKKLKSIRAVPDKTVRNLKEDAWATRHMKSNES